MLGRIRQRNKIVPLKLTISILQFNNSYEGNLNWLNYLGDWGNSEDGCQYEIITGECELGSGPSGPITKNDYFPEI